MSKILKILFVGDIIGQPGCHLFQRHIPKLKRDLGLHAVIVNGENATKNGMGVNGRQLDFFKNHGADVITLGNHAFDQKDVYQALNERDDVIRPANYPPGLPGRGHTFIKVADTLVAIVNLHGRVFSRDMLDCPFRAIDSLLTFLKTKTNCIFIDFHAEATSEKRAFGAYVDGRVSGVYGTHTHVQTADEMIMPGGTSYLTDLGGCGALYSVIGMEQGAVIDRFTKHAKMGKFVVEEKGPMVLCGLVVEVDAATGKSISVNRIRIIDTEIEHQLKAEAS